MVIPNYKNLGFADTLWTQLKALIEKQLSDDFKYYDSQEQNKLKFDWSNSMIEWNYSTLLDWAAQNFSWIKVFNNNDRLIAEGWMNFIHNGEFFISYWEFLDIYNQEMKIDYKKSKCNYIPKHILAQLQDKVKNNLNKNT